MGWGGQLWKPFDAVWDGVCRKNSYAFFRVKNANLLVRWYFFNFLLLVKIYPNSL